MVMLILTLLLGAVFGVVRATLELNFEMTQAQQAEARTRGFAQLCEGTFRHLPADAMVRHRVVQKNGQYLFQLVVQGGRDMLALHGAADREVLVLESEEQAGGYLRIVMLSLTREEAQMWEKGNSRLGTSLMLLENVAQVDWSYFHPESGAWEPVWNERQPLGSSPVISSNPMEGNRPAPATETPSTLLGRILRPQLVKLELQPAGGSRQQWTFWTPPAETPSTGRVPDPPPPATPPVPGPVEGPP